MVSHNTLHSIFSITLLLLIQCPGAFSWLYTRSSGACSSFQSCQDCVVEYAMDSNIRRPCTWCAETATCQMMNHYTGYCSEGQANTYRETCPIVAETLPRCITFTYSFWVCTTGRPQTASQCNLGFVNDFCSKWTNGKQVELCNGETKVIETVTTGFGQQNALKVSKNPYGVDVNLIYFWFNAGYGEDRRRIETTRSDDSSFTWLCNANDSPAQATAVKYRITTDDTPSVPLNDDDGSNESPSHAIPLLSARHLVFLLMIPAILVLLLL